MPSHFENSRKVRLDALIRGQHQLSWAKARDWIESGKVWIGGQPAKDPSLMVEEGSVPDIRMNTPRSSGRIEMGKVTAEPRVVFVDSQLIVINKPSGLSSVPYQENERDTLEFWVNHHLGDKRVKVVHRLDRETSGLIVYARTREAEEKLANQFRFHSIHRRYLALAHGSVREQTIRSEILENRGDGLRGSVQRESAVSRVNAKKAVTHVRVKEYFPAFTLIECELETGRTHQIRIHLSEAGHPLLGEKAYHRDYRGDWIEAPRIMLHAAELGFVHPTRGVPMSWTQVPPRDFLNFLKR